MYLSLHTADPGRYGIKATELFYLGYERIDLKTIAVRREVNGITNGELIRFAECRDWRFKPLPITHFAISGTATREGKVLAAGRLDWPIQLNKGVTPCFVDGGLDIDFEHLAAST